MYQIQSSCIINILKIRKLKSVGGFRSTSAVEAIAVETIAVEMITVEVITVEAIVDVQLMC